MGGAFMRCLLCQCGEKMAHFTTVKSQKYFEETEKRSKFISYSFPINSESEAMGFIKQIKAKHPNAKHYVYAYLIEGLSEKYSDDGEPTGTGGLPVLNAIKSMNLSNVLVIVVRYFGGILLGTGGLRKMYGSGAVNVLNISEKVNLISCVRMRADIDYHNYNKILSIILKFGAIVVKTDYLNCVTIEFSVKEEIETEVRTRISDILKTNDAVCTLFSEYCVL